LLVAVVFAAPARGDDVRLQWPLGPGVPTVTRGFDAPRPDWQRGHRGVDLAGAPGQPVYSAGRGTVVFAGLLAGRPVVSVDHPGGLRTSYEPVEAVVPGCPVAACLHWGAMWGPAQRADYVDPVGLLETTPIRLKPLTQARGWA
jgi:hypothetical protein